MNDLIEFVQEQIIVLVPVLYVIGAMLKNTPKMPDWLIPWTLLIVGILLAVLIMGDPLQGVIQGILVAGATVMAHQLIKQTGERE
jgi:MFS superfamily sulfate permease-like transporter